MKSYKVKVQIKRIKQKSYNNKIKYKTTKKYRNNIKNSKKF